MYAFSNEDDIYSLTSAVAYDYSDLIRTSITMRYEAQNSNWAVTAIPATLNIKLPVNCPVFLNWSIAKPKVRIMNMHWVQDSFMR